MVNKVIEATAMRIGSYILIDGEAYSIKGMDVSKTGKHGHAKVRFEAVSAIGKKKKVMVVPGHERFEVPEINKKKAQVLSIKENIASLMDSESFEGLDLNIPEDLREEVKEGILIEYWDIEGEKVIRRVL